MQSNKTNIPCDEQLVNEVLNNDPDAFKQLYYKYFEALVRFAYYRLNSMEFARDFVQEVFTQIWIKRNTLNPKKSIKSFLYKSLSNLIINHYKSHSSRTISFEDVKTEMKSGDDFNLELSFDLRNAINQLPEKLKSVFMLSRYEGFKYSEIAEICNISVKAVEKRMSQALAKLRDTFSEKYFKVR